MPLRKDIHKVMVLGSGPIVIGQAAEFDYAGTQACRALREEGLEVVLVNSNPATIMTDKAMADKVYIEPLTVEAVQEIIKKERPDSLLPNLGGQTGLNLAMELCESGFLDKMASSSSARIRRPSPRRRIARCSRTRWKRSVSLASRPRWCIRSRMRSSLPVKSACRSSSVRRIRSAARAAALPIRGSAARDRRDRHYVFPRR